VHTDFKKLEGTLPLRYISPGLPSRQIRHLMTGTQLVYIIMFWSGSAFLVVPLLTTASPVDQYLVYLDGEPFAPLLLASYWCLMLLLQLGSVAHSPLLVPPPGMDSPWKSASCLEITKVCFPCCLRLICIAVAGLGAPLSRFLEGVPYKFLNERMNKISSSIKPAF